MKKKILLIIGTIALLVAIITLFIVLKPKEQKQYTITFETNGGTKIEDQTILEGELVRKPIDPVKEGYKFISWLYENKTYDFSEKVFSDMELIAKWYEIKEDTATYTITFNSDGGSTIPNQIVEEGNLITKPENPTKENYEFIGWYLNEEEYNFETKVNSDINLIAKWEQKTHIVTFDSNGGSNVSKQTVAEGNKASAPNAPTREGYTFIEWQLDGVKYNFDTKVTKNITLVAKWQKVNTYTVTFDSNGGSNVSKQTVAEGNKASAPNAPTREGYTFIEWQLDGQKYNFDTKVTKNITLVAKWQKVNTYTVTFDSNGGSNVSKQTVAEGNKASAPNAPTKEGYTFLEWQLDGVKYNFDTKVTKNITLVAKWQKVNTYTVTFDSNGGSNVSNQTVAEGNKASKPSDPTKEGYTFGGWTLNGQNYDFSSNVTSNITLVATWAQKKYEVIAQKADLTAPFSRKLNVYEEGTVITVKEIQYSDGIKICSGSNPNVNYYSINEETTLKLVLSSGTVVTASLTIEQ